MMNKLKTYLPPSQVTHILYHGSCKDGFAAAFAGYLLEQEIPTMHTCYIPVYPNKPPKRERVKGGNIVLVDVTFPRHVIQKMLQWCNRLVILDHHAFVERELGNVEGLQLFLDVNHAACHIAWRYFHGRRKPFPLFMRYIEVRDLYLNDSEEGHFFALAFYDSIPYDFEVYASFLKEEKVSEYVARGKVMYDIISKRVELFDIPHAQKRYLHIGSMSAKVYVLNCSHYVDLVGNMIAEHYRNDADFVILWYYNHAAQRSHCMLRSAEGKMDVSFVAQYFGGGGHPHAASFMLSRGISVEEILE